METYKITIVGHDYIKMSKKQMMMACKNGDIDLVKKLVSENIGLAIFKSNPFVILAAYHGHLDIIKYLHENGAAINTRNSQALRNAVNTWNLEIAKYLIDNGADVTSNNNECIKTALEVRDIGMIKYLVSKGADINANSGYIEQAASRGDILFVELLIQLGANINKDNSWVLREAIYHDQLNMVKYLVPKYIDNRGTIQSSIYLSRNKNYHNITNYLNKILKEDQSD